MNKQQIISTLITISIIGILFLFGSASAISLKLSDFSDTLKGNKVSTNLDIEINSNERIELNNISIYLNGIYLCEFNHKTLDSNCQGIEIEKLTSNENFGYGYGYSYGYSYGYGYGYNQGYSGTKLSYKLTFDTSNIPLGENKIFIQTDIGRIYKSDEKILNVYESSSSSSSSSGGSFSGIWKKKVVEPVEESTEDIINNNETILLIPEIKTKGNWFVNIFKKIWDWIIFWR